MHKVTYYPLGNADSILIDLNPGESNAKKLLFDYANKRNPNDPKDKRIDLATTLRADLKAAKRNAYNVVAFTHLDDDHIHGATAFFHLDYNAKYQGENRVHMDEMWVPAAVIMEPACEDEARVIQLEARHRFREKKGIRVFSGPDRLKEWCENNGLNYESRKHLITNAGELVPGFTNKKAHGVEFFSHSPFAHVQNKTASVQRNDDALVLQGTFDVSNGLTERDTYLILGSDVNHEILSEIVRLTRYKKNEGRLLWDIFKLPHHCSYTTLGPEKGKDKTKPVPEVEWLLEQQGRRGGILVSTSDPIPTVDTDQPPHRQAANYYRERAQAMRGEFKVTMEHPNTVKPEPLVMQIDGSGVRVVKRNEGGSACLNTPAPRAGI